VSERTVDELLVVIARALGAASARVLPASEADALQDDLAARGGLALRCDLVGGRRLVVELASAPKDATALQRRLEMLVETFADLLPRPPRARPSSRPEGARTLHDELITLVQRAGAADALVIDAHSPVIWGSATEPEATSTEDDAVLPPTPLHRASKDDAQAALQGLASAQGVRVDPGAMAVVPRAVCARHRVLPIARSGDKLVLAMADPQNADAIRDVVLTTGLDVEPVFAGETMAAFFNVLDDGSGAATYEQAMAAVTPEHRAEREPKAERARLEWLHAMRTRRVLADLRALAELDTLRKGGHLRRMMSEGDLHYVARSFAGIYVLVVVYDGPFEELLAKRALAHALPTVERLVAALPPLDPTPQAGAIAIRRRRRR
jgi:hypothetical protein